MRKSGRQIAGSETMKILVTGASGGLGRHLLRYLAGHKGLEVRALVHRSPVGSTNGTTGDLLDIDSLVQATEGVDMVVHLAALTHTNRMEDYYRVNVDGTGNLLRACATNGVKRFIYVSSRAASRNGGSYAESKAQGEDLVKGSGLLWTILRPSEVFGPDSPDAINKLILWIRKFIFVPVIGDGGYTLSPAYVDDVIEAIGRCILNPEEGKTWVLSGPEEMSFTELVDRICGFLRVSRFKVFVPVFLAKWMVEILIWIGIEFLVRDQIPRLLCDKSDDAAPPPPNYHPRKIEQGLSRFRL